MSPESGVKIICPESSKNLNPTLQIQQLEIAGDDSDSGLDSDGNYGHVSGLRRRHLRSSTQNSIKSNEYPNSNIRDSSRPTSVLSRFVNSSTPAFWTYIAGRNGVIIYFQFFL